MKPHLQISTSQQLVMTPQLRQALHILQLSSVELETELIAAVESNPLLEWQEASEASAADGPDDAEAPAARSEPDEGASDDWGERGLLDDAGPWGSGGEGEDDDWRENAVAGTPDLHDHLLWQLHLSRLSPRELAVCVAIVDAIDDDGYLRSDAAAIAESLAPECSVDAEEIATALARVQQLDPTGVGARSLGECLALQLRLLPDDEPGRDTALRIARDHIESLPKASHTQLAHRLGCQVGEVDAALALLRAMDPRPGAAFAPLPQDTYIVPDCAIWRHAGTWQCGLLGGMAHRLGIQQDYARLAKTAGGEDGSYLRGQLQEARWLLRSLQSRDETLMKILRCLLREQAAFLEFGPRALRPLTLRQVATMIEMHESTVSRAVSRKHVRTPNGTLALRDFFASGVADESGETTSSTAIQAMIRSLVDAEPPSKPLSDAAITSRLNAQGIPVARRTVAKYREAMHILPSHQRTRMP